MSNNLISDRLNDLYKKYFQNTDYQLGDSFDSVRSNMSAEDYDVSQRLLSYYGQQKAQEAEYNYSKDALDKNKNIALQENSIAREKAKKYMPEYLKLNGLGGLGLSESAVISLNNNYRNTRNEINSNTEAQKAELLKNYNANINDLNQNASLDSDSIREKYLNEAKVEGTKNYNNFKELLNDQRFETIEEARASYEKIADTMSEGERSDVNNMLNVYENDLRNYKSAEELNRINQEIQNMYASGQLLSSEEKDELIKFAESKRNLLTESDKKQLDLILGSYKTMSETEEKEYNRNKYWKNTLKDDYGVEESNIDNGILSSAANVKSFGTFSKNRGDQDKHVQKILDNARNGNINNGDIFDFNNKGGEAYYVYWNGYWYKTSKSYTRKVKDLK